MATTTRRTSSKGRRSATTPAQRAARDAAREERLAELHEQIVAGVEALTDSDAWRAMLRTAATFHRYSFRNQLLIAAQAPHATQVAGFTTWQRLGRQVRKGEQGIAILAPRTAKVADDANTDTSDSADTATAGAQNAAERPADAGEGKASTPRPRRVMRGVKAAFVFDISQTDGDPLPTLPSEPVTGEVPAALWDGLTAQVHSHGYQVERGDCGTAEGYTDPRAHVVRISGTDRDAAAFNTLTHELAHIVCGHVDDVPTYATCRGRCEIEAESVAYVVAGAHGIDTSGSTFGYVAGWAHGHADQVIETAETVTRTAHTILTTLDEGQDDGGAEDPEQEQADQVA